jgi:myo-inositol-hexaphosphate 3-phosphohydrolase
VDLAVVSDRANDTLAIYAIDPHTLLLTDVTSAGIPETIFGVDDGSHTVYGLATYRSPITGKAYAFVCQRSGNLVAQLELFDDGAGAVNARIVRTLELPVPTGDPEDSQAEGMVVDPDHGLLYVAVEGEVGIVKTAAEPDTAGNWILVYPIDAPFLKPDIEGLTIYYGCQGHGYLLVSSQGDSTFAVLDRRGDNAYLGSFVVADYRGIDQANESDGAHVVSAPLGRRYPFGLLVVQDGANDPQNVVQDGEQLENNSTNFKFIRWDDLARAFSPQLRIEKGCSLPNPK